LTESNKANATYNFSPTGYDYFYISAGLKATPADIREALMNFKFGVVRPLNESNRMLGAQELIDTLIEEAEAQGFFPEPSPPVTVQRWRETSDKKPHRFFPGITERSKKCRLNSTRGLETLSR